MQYEVGKQWWFPQLGRTANPGEVIELEEGIAEHYRHNEPGLLKPIPSNAQAKVKVTREQEPRKKRSRADS